MRLAETLKPDRAILALEVHIRVLRIYHFYVLQSRVFRNTTVPSFLARSESCSTCKDVLALFLLILYIEALAMLIEP